MTVAHPELVDSFVDTFSVYVDEHPEWNHFEFAMGDKDQVLLDAVRDGLVAKYPERTFVVADRPSPDVLRRMMNEGWFD
jgi:hypothetical protein